MFCLICRWKLVALLALQVLLLTTPFSHAKGGGGGGHVGGGRGRQDLPPYKRHAREEPAWMWLMEHLDPLGYHNVPRLQEVVSVLVDQNTRTYVAGNVTSVRENGWFVVAVHSNDIYNNHTHQILERVVGTDHAGDYEETTDTPHLLYFGIRASSNWGEWLFLGLLVFLCWIRNLHLRSHDREAQAFDAALAKELLVAGTTTTNPPVSGSYMGFTNESDGSDQRVDVELEFGDDGQILGQGMDSEDGRYTLKGTYSETRVEWIEYYDDKNKPSSPIQSCTLRGKQPLHQVTVRGTYKGGRRFVCFFRSSRGVTGTVTLGLKKKVVEAEGEEDELRRRRTCKADSLEETPESNASNARGPGSLNTQQV